MKTELLLKPPVAALDHILSSAVVLNWNALTCQPAPTMLRLEYHVGRDSAIENLKLWARSREYWTLICDYTPNVGWTDGPRFANGYHSRSLGRLFQSILMDQSRFHHAYAPNTNATLKIQTPTAEDTLLAYERVNEAFPGPEKAAAALLARRRPVVPGSTRPHAKTSPHFEAQE
jgi:hypothetical protein